MKKKPKKLTPEYWADNAAFMRRLEDRIAYHERKLAAEREKN
jgi:hypothetical protein